MSGKHFARFGPLAAAAMLASMQVLPRTRDELHEASGLNRQTISRWIIQLRRHGLVHRAAYKRTGDKPVRYAEAFLLGNGVDVPYPKMTPTQRSRLCRRRRAQAHVAADHLGRVHSAD